MVSKCFVFGVEDLDLSSTSTKKDTVIDNTSSDVLIRTMSHVILRFDFDAFGKRFCDSAGYGRLWPVARLSLETEAEEPTRLALATSNGRSVTYKQLCLCAFQCAELLLPHLHVTGLMSKAFKSRRNIQKLILQKDLLV